jgi:acylglycerol lipase
VLSIFLAALALASCANVPQGSMTPSLGINTWTSFDGKMMPWRHDEVPKGQPVRAVVITVHGLSGASSDFWMLGDHWPQRGVAVYGLELRGQGNDLDLSRRGDIRSAQIWQKDLLAFHGLVSARHPGVPVYWYTESMGSLIALHAADTAAEPPEGIVFSSPAAGIRLPISSGRMLMLRSASTLMPRRKVSLEKLGGVKDDEMRVTQETTFEAQMAKTPHYVPEFTLRLLNEVYTMMQTSPRALRRLKMPALVLASPNDIIASPEQMQKFFELIGSPDKKLLWYRKSFHLLLHDVQREEVLRDATSWLEEHLRMAGQKKILR